MSGFDPKRTFSYMIIRSSLHAIERGLVEANQAMELARNSGRTAVMLTHRGIFHSFNWDRNLSHIPILFLVFPLMILFHGCSQKQNIILDNSTYPQNAERTVTISWPAKNPLFTTTMTKEFTNEHEQIIDSTDVRTTDRFKMMNFVPKRSKQVCGSKYKVISTKYYTGKEATSRMLGRGKAWLKFVVRCPIRGSATSPSPSIKAVENLTKNVLDSEYFDSHSHALTFPYDVVWDTVSATLIRNDDNIWQKDKDKGLIVTDQTRHGMLGFTQYYQYYILIEKFDSNKTILSFKLFNYFRQMNKSPTTRSTVRLKPMSRYLVYKASVKFIESIIDNLVIQKG